jgi:nucleotide-binding universal stress UspA family protein
MAEGAKVIWAVDPFEENVDLQSSAAWAVRAIARGRAAATGQAVKVEPVYVFSAYSLDVPFEVPSDLIEQVRTTGEESLQPILSRVRIPGLEPLQVLARPYLPVNEAVEELLDYSHSSGTDLIIASSRARRGPTRWIHGSFAETLALHSDVPTLVVNPLWNRIPEFRHVLFPTDFSDASKGAFQRVLEFARSLGAEITVFHKVKYDLTPGVEVAFSAYPAYQELFSAEIEARHEEAMGLVREAARAGVQAHAFIDYQLSGSVAEAIVNRAERHPGIIAMVAHTGPVAAAVLGSSTRKVIRSAPVPVWIVHPRQREREKKAAA